MTPRRALLTTIYSLGVVAGLLSPAAGETYIGGGDG